MCSLQITAPEQHRTFVLFISRQEFLFFIEELRTYVNGEGSCFGTRLRVLRLFALHKVNLSRTNLVAPYRNDAQASQKSVPPHNAQQSSMLLLFVSDPFIKAHPGFG
jgi:hypothetical protein